MLYILHAQIMLLDVLFAELCGWSASCYEGSVLDLKAPFWDPCSTGPGVYLSTIYLWIHLSLYLSIYLSIYLSVYPNILVHVMYGEQLYTPLVTE